MDKLEKLKQELLEFSKERDWDKYHTPKNLAAALSVEASELLEIFQWLNDNEAGASPSNLEIKTRTADELADVFIYLVRLADKMGVDLFDAASAKLKKNAVKYPVDKSKGNARKYSEL